MTILSIFRKKDGVSRRVVLTRRAITNAFALFVVVLTFCGHDLSFAQSNALNAYRSEPTHPNEKTTFWLLESDGSWRVPLPNWSLEDVMRAVDANEEEESVSPYAIQSVDANGKIQDGIARLTIQIAVNAADGVVRVPLGLQEGVYIPDVSKESESNANAGVFSFEGPGFCALDVDPETGDYVAILQSPRRGRRRQPGGSRTDEQRNEPPVATVSTPVEEDAKEQSVPTKPESAPSEPEQTQPASEEPTSESAPSEPEQTQPASEEPRSEPAPSEPEQTPPASEEPTSEPAPSEPEQTQPVSEEPTSASAPSEPSSVLVPEPTSSASFATILEKYAERVEEGAVEVVAEGADESSAVSREELNSPRLRPNQYLLTLELCFVVETLGVDEYRLIATFPSSVHSQLTLETPTPDAHINSVKGAIASPTTVLNEESTELKLRGLGRGGERTELVWQKTETSQMESRLVYQVEDAKIDVALGVRETTYDVVLPVRIFGGESDVYRVELPERATLIDDSVVAVGSNGALFNVRSVHESSETPSSADGSTTASSERPTVEIRLDQKTSAVVLKLKARVQIVDDETSALDALEKSKHTARAISGFSVVDAQKQYGQVKIARTQELDFTTSSVYGASSTSEGAFTEGEEFFSFFAQPFLLTAQAYDRRSIVNVKPEYQLTVGAEVAQMRARLQFSVSGSQVKELRVRLNGWAFLFCDDEGSVESESVYINNSTGESIFPLKTPSDGEIVLNMTLSHNFDLNENSEIELLLPTPAADWVEPAATVVFSENNVELQPIVERCSGLTPKLSRAFSLNFDFPKLAQEPLFFQANQISSEGDAPSPNSFVAQLKRMTRKTTVKILSDVFVQEHGEVRINQTLLYDVEYEALDSVTLQVPIKLFQLWNQRHAEGCKIFVDGKQIPPQNYRMESLNDEDKSGSLRIVFPDEPKIGAFTVSIQYDNEPFPFQSSTTGLSDFCLTQPTEKENVSNELRVTYPTRVVLSYEGSAGSFWKFDRSEFASDAKSQTSYYLSTTSESLARFGGVSNEEDALGSTIVERAWIQTWASRVGRVDRVAYRMTCNQDHVDVKLPESTRQDRVSVSLNGKPFNDVGEGEHGGLFWKDPHTLRVPISSELHQSEFVLELAYVVTNSSMNEIVSNGRCAFDLPYFVDKPTWIRRSYWQIVVPYNRHIVVSPRNWTPEYMVKRNGASALFSRVASMTQDDLSEWVGVGKREAFPSDVNVYLFSSFEQPSHSRFYLADRALLVLVGSGVVLALGLGLIYVPMMRSRFVIFIVCLIALACASYHPTLALFFLQTAGVGVVLSIVTALCAFIFNRRGVDRSRAIVSRLTQTDGRGEGRKRENARVSEELAQ